MAQEERNSWWETGEKDPKGSSDDVAEGERPSRDRKKSNKSPHRNKSIDEIRERRNRKKAKEAEKKKLEEEETTLFEEPAPKTPDELRAELEEIKRKLKESKENKEKKIAEYKQMAKDGKKELDEKYGTQISEKKGEKERHERHHSHIQAGAQKIMAKLRDANHGLRAIATKLPKQNKELKRTNNAYDRTTQQILMQNEALQQFCEKLQQDQKKLQMASDIHRDEYIPFYRVEIREKQRQVDLETKIKNMYREAMIKVCKRIVNTKELDLIEQISMRILEVEGQFNPSFDPSVLFVREDGTKARDSDDDSDDDGDDDSSSSSSSSDDSSAAESKSDAGGDGEAAAAAPAAAAEDGDAGGGDDDADEVSISDSD